MMIVRRSFPFDMVYALVFGGVCQQQGQVFSFFSLWALPKHWKTNQWIVKVNNLKGFIELSRLFTHCEPGFWHPQNITLAFWRSQIKGCHMIHKKSACIHQPIYGCFCISQIAWSLHMELAGGKWVTLHWIETRSVIWFRNWKRSIVRQFSMLVYPRLCQNQGDLA